MPLGANQREGMPFGNAARLSGHCYHLASNKALALTGEEMVTEILMVLGKVCCGSDGNDDHFFRMLMMVLVILKKLEILLKIGVPPSSEVTLS